MHNERPADTSRHEDLLLYVQFCHLGIFVFHSYPESLHGYVRSARANIRNDPAAMLKASTNVFFAFLILLDHVRVRRIANFKLGAGSF
jgi:hypothetical protein